MLFKFTLFFQHTCEYADWPLVVHATQERPEHPLESRYCFVSDESHSEYCTLEVVVDSNEDGQRHVELVGLVGRVKCDTISKIFVRSPAAGVRLEYVAHTVIDIFVVIIEELGVYLLHLLKESQEFLHIVLCFLPRELVLPAVRNNNILAALGTYRKCTKRTA